MAISIKEMKNEIKKSGSSKGKILYVREDDKKRVRFLCDAEDGLELTFHDSFAEGIDVLCNEELGKDCKYCEMDSLRTRKKYAWPVWDYDAKEIKILIFAANNCTPVPAIVGMYETYETLLDRDFVISRTGKQQNTNYTVIPMDKSKFKTKIKDSDISKKKLLKIISQANKDDASSDNDDDDFDDEDEKPTKKSKKKAKKKSNDELEDKLSDLTLKELKSLAKEMEVKVTKKMESDDIIEKLLDEDEEELEEAYEELFGEDKEDPDDEEDDDEEEDYDNMSVKELFKLCKEREIKCKPKKDKEYYISLLEEDDNLPF